VAVGGSNGKTTTKEMLATLCGEAWQTWASPASFNNDVGVPLTLLGLGSEHEVAVVEVGTNHPGELAPLLRMVVPRYGVMTSLGREHLEFFGNLEGVVKEEGVLGEFLPAEGTLFTSGDDAGVEEVVKRSKAPVVRVGLGVENEWRITNVKSGVMGTSFALEAVRGDMSGSYKVGLVGRHHVRNVVMAMAVVAELGMSRELMERGLAKCRPVSRRMEVWVAGGVRVLDDSYNANVDSMAAALGTLVELPCEGRRMAVLGDMAELGIAEELAHAEVGRCAASLGLDQLIAVGRLAGVMGAAAREAGMHRVMELASAEAAAHAVPRLVRRGDLVLVKASRATGLERVSEALRKGDRGQV
jgi:UDP-N-acetylmuramoyl-tripeptide--D-alanyl-D-alanine ligase